jgi:diguanylate cyclase (GGDEF)-like protein
MLNVRRIDEEPVAVEIGSHEFPCEEETGYVTLPKDMAIGFRLSDIPEDISIKPVEAIEGNVIHVENNIAISAFRDGVACVDVEEMFRRKFWDGETGLTPYVVALRQAIAEEDSSNETDFQDDDDYIFLHYDIALTSDLEMQAALGLIDTVIERIHERTDQLVHRRKDGLLGIFDRGSFDADLAYAVSGTHNAALLLVDLDYFKQVNDKFGHPVGDLVLSAVARIIDSKCGGPNRVAYRYGGEELAIVLRGDSVAMKTELAESIRGEVEMLRFNGHPTLKVTISIGVAEKGDSDRGELIRRADAALYRAKNVGRNRIECG